MQIKSGKAPSKAMDLSFSGGTGAEFKSSTNKLLLPMSDRGGEHSANGDGIEMLPSRTRVSFEVKEVETEMSGGISDSVKLES